MRPSRIVTVVIWSMGPASVGACTKPGEESSYCADLADDLDATCPELDQVIVDDDGRVRQLPQE